MDGSETITSMPCGKMTTLPTLNLSGCEVILSSLSLALGEASAFRFRETVRPLLLVRVCDCLVKGVVDGSDDELDAS